MSVKMTIEVPKWYIGKIFVDPLEEIEGTLNVTIIQFNKILYFSKRRGFDKYEAYIKRHNFIIPNGEKVLNNLDLKEEEYLELLLTKSKEVQEKANYLVKEECVTGGNLEAIAMELGILKGENKTIVNLLLSTYKKDGYREKDKK